MKFRKKPNPVEAITFDEFLDYGRANGANIVEGMPWSFNYQGYAVTHENDNLYTLTKGTMLMLRRGDMLITRADGLLWMCPADLFLHEYEAVT